MEKSRKTDLAECKMRYDNQISVVSEELHSLQNQVTRFKRERDTYKHMLEGAQKNLGELKLAASKSGRERQSSMSSSDDVSTYYKLVINFILTIIITSKKFTMNIYFRLKTID